PSAAIASAKASPRVLVVAFIARCPLWRWSVSIRQLELARNGEERELVVGLPEALGQHPDDAPEDLVGQVFVEKEQVFERILGQGEEAAALVDARVCRPRGLVEERHLPEDRAGTEHRERLLSHARHVAADADLAFEDDVELVAGIPVLEDLGPERVR